MHWWLLTCSKWLKWFMDKLVRSIHLMFCFIFSAVFDLDLSCHDLSCSVVAFQHAHRCRWCPANICNQLQSGLPWHIFHGDIPQAWQRRWFGSRKWIRVKHEALLWYAVYQCVSFFPGKLSFERCSDVICRTGLCVAAPITNGCKVWWPSCQRSWVHNPCPCFGAKLVTNIYQHGDVQMRASWT